MKLHALYNNSSSQLAFLLKTINLTNILVRHYMFDYLCVIYESLRLLDSLRIMFKIA